MASTAATLTPFHHSSSPTNTKPSYAKPKFSFVLKNPNHPRSVINGEKSITLLSTFPLLRNAKSYTYYSPKVASASSALSSQYTEEPQTKVKFPKSLSLPGCSSSLSLFGTGYREKVFAIIGVKVYAAGLYANPSIFSELDAWRGRSPAEVQQDSTLFNAIFQAPMEKSLHIVLVRDVDGKTFWDALDEAISPRIKSPTSIDESALSIFRGVFQGRPLNKGTSIFLTWPDTTKILVCISADGMPSSVDAMIESSNVASALFDVFVGGNPVSPSLKASISNGLAAALK